MQSGVNKLHFWGEREKPSTLDELMRKPPILGMGSPPKETLEVANAAIYVMTQDKNRPSPEIHEFSRTEHGTLWKISFPHTAGHTISPLPGQSALREHPDKIRGEINPRIDFTGHRPEWQHQFFSPRSAPQISETLRRFNGNIVKPAYVFGPDDRQVYQDTSYPWGCVGKVINNEGKAGSGALVGRDLMVTAGHVVPWNSVRAGSWWMRFVPDYFDGTSLFGPGVESYVSDVRGYDTGNTVAGYDWAICKLYNPLGPTTGWFGFNGYSSDWENWNVWYVTGYPGAIVGGQRPEWQSGISILDDDGDSNDGQELESETADISPGNSGGPIFGFWNNDPRVIGVVSGEESEYRFLQGTQDNNIFSSGSGFCNLIAWGRSNW